MEPQSNNANERQQQELNSTASKSPGSDYRLQSTASIEPPVVLPPLPGYKKEVADSNPFHDVEDLLERLLGKESYGAPRVFDLFTMLAITLAFALMFAFLRLIEPLLMGDLEIVAISLGTFVTGIAIFQLALWEGNKPRISSLVAGPVLIFGILFFVGLFSPSIGIDLPYVLATVCLSIFGIPAGYLGGAMVAGVFLVADVFRTNFLRTKTENISQNDDAIFVESTPEDASNSKETKV